MSQTIDERVVEMRFDNKQFEQGVKETMTTLDKLKASLDMEESAKSFDLIDKMANNVSLEGISSGIEALQKRFSTLGIVGMRVIENITDSLMGMASKAISYVDDAIISGGLRRAQNIENAHFQLQALLKDEEAVQAVMDNAMTSVDGTAYAYDEAAKAASQFAASGMKAGEEMISALRGITGVAAMTNSEYEGISRIFTTVAGNGRLMGDQLLQLSSRGLNAAATIADYFREVQGQAKTTESDIRKMVSDGQISFKIFAEAMDWAFGESAFRANETFTGALSNMRSALARIGAEFYSPLIEQNSDLVLLINSIRERINDVKKALTFDEQRSAISGLTKATNLGSDALEKMFKSIDENGSVSKENLKDLALGGIDASKELVKYINGVTDGTIRTTYATKTAIAELTNGLTVSKTEVAKFVEDGKIDLKMFTSAMETAYGDQKALSKQFTTSVLDMAKTVSSYLKNLDLTKPMTLIYYGVETVKNVFKGLFSVLKPVGKAFSNVFLTFNMDSVLDLADKIETLTSKMKLSEEASENLHDAFKGVFSVAKLLIDAIAGIVGVVVPVGKPIVSFTDLILRLAGAMGRGLSSFTEWINKSPRLNKVYTVLATNVQKAMSSVSGFIRNIDDFANYIYNLPIVQRIVNKIARSFTNLYESGVKYFPILTKTLKEFGERIAVLIPEKAKELFTEFIKKVKDLKDNLSELNLETVTNLFHKFTEKLKELLEVFKGNEGLSVFISNMKDYFKNMADAFTFDALISNIEKFKTTIGGFVEWFRDTVSPMFKDFSFGGTVATAGGFGMIFAAIKMFSAFGKVADVAVKWSSIIGSLKSTLTAFQQDLKADAILKIAKSITLIAIAITVLSFADTERAYHAVVMLGLIAGVLALAVAYMTKSATALNDLTKAIKWKAIGNAIKDIGISIGIITAAIIALAFAYSKDADNMDKALYLVTIMFTVIIGIILIMSAIGNQVKDGMKGFASASFGILALSIALVMVISSLKKLFKLEIPPDWDKKMLILSGVFVGLAGLTLAIAVAARVAGEEGSGASLVLPIISLAAALYIAVSALGKLFKMSLPADYEKKFALLATIFGGFVLAILALGVASKLSKGGLKATGTLLAMCLVMATLVGSLVVLSMFPGEKIFKAVMALGISLIALSISLAGAGKIIGSNNWKSVAAMVLQIGVLTASLGVLSMIPGESLLKAVIALGSMLIVLAQDFKAISKITDQLSWMSILSMAANVIFITLSLYVLAEQPWDSLIFAGASLGIVLLSVAEAFQIMSKANVDMTKITAFLLGMVGALFAAFSIAIIAKYDWKSLIAAGASLALVVDSMAAAFAIMSKATPDLGTLAGFLAGIVGIAVIGFVIKDLADQPWENLLGAAGSISMVLIALAVAMSICTIAGTFSAGAAAGIVLLDVFIADLTAVVLALGGLASIAGDLISTGGQVLIDLGNYLGKFIGNIIAGIEEGKAAGLAATGAGLSDFANNASDFFDMIGNGLDEQLLKGVQNLLDSFKSLKEATKIAKNLDIPTFGDSLKEFGTAIAGFSNEVKNINSEAVAASGYCASAISELYSNLPKEEGWTSIFTGKKKSLEDFGFELTIFGSAIADYSAIVSGNIDEGAVTASIRAAKTISGLYENLPDIGGLYQKIFGTKKKLSDFAYEIIIFGQGIVSYSDIVTDRVSESAVQASIDAAEILRAFNENLPDIGGLTQLIFGHQKSLSEFSDEIVKFGQGIVKYSGIVSGNIDTTAIVDSAIAAQSLANLGNSLGGDKGLLSFFTRDANLEDFGKELKKFGKGLAEYSDSIDGIKTSQLASVTEEISKLIEIAKDTQGLDTSGMKGFAEAMKKMGNSGIDGFIQSFTDSSEKVKSTVESFVSNVGNALLISGKELTTTSKKLSQNIETGLDTGLRSGLIKTMSTIIFVTTSIINTMEQQLTTNKFNTIGQSIIESVSFGMNSNRILAVKSAENVSNSIIQTFINTMSRSAFSEIGTYAAEGLADGIKNSIGGVTNAAISAASSAISAAKNTLKINSPSKVFMEIGEYVSQGLAKGIVDETQSIESATEYAADTSIDVMNQLIQSIAKALEDNPDFEPTIRPVLDLSLVEGGLSQISNMFNEKIRATYDRSMLASNSFVGRSTNLDQNDRNGENSDEPNTYQFIQNNYSPKALSRVEIYRQSKNLFSTWKGAVENS